MLVLVLKVEVKPGKKQEFIEIAKVMIAGSQKEAGNIEYDLYEDLEDENTVVFLEKWEDKAALELHETLPHFTQNIGKVKALCAKPPVCYTLGEIK